LHFHSNQSKEDERETFCNSSLAELMASTSDFPEVAQNPSNSSTSSPSLQSSSETPQMHCSQYTKDILNMFSLEQFNVVVAVNHVRGSDQRTNCRHGETRIRNDHDI
jgi:hypothetical protein